MKKILSLLFLFIFSTALLYAENQNTADYNLSPAFKQKQQALSELIAKYQEQGIEVISSNGAVTRASCPHTCESRDIPKEHCKTWPSPSEPDKCYVWDTRLPQDAVRF